MIRDLLTLASFCLSLTSCRSSQVQGVSSPEEIVRGYVQAQQTLMQASAGEPQIQAILAFLADSFVYEHPRANATISGKQAYTEGLRQFLGRTQHAQVRILRTLVNGGVVVTEQELTFEVQREGTWQPDGRTQVTVFDIANGQIVRILDFWQPRP